MRAARYYGEGDVRIEDVEPDDVGPNDVRIDVAACGICGSDLHEYAAGPMTIPTEPHPVTGEALPFTIGHEIGGTVAEVGENVDVAVGTTVAVNPIVWCGSCRPCERGDYHLCENGGFVGLSRNGGFAENVVVSAEKVVPVPDAVSPELASLVEPFSVGLHAVHQADLSAGESVVVFGGGPIGNTVAQAARAANAGPVYLSEPQDARREAAERVGVEHVIDPMETDPVEHVRAATGGVDVAFEVAGIEQTLNQAIDVTRAGGRTTIVSLFEESATVHPTDVVTRERTVNGTAAFHGGPRSQEEAGVTARNFADGTLDPEALVTARIALEDIVEEGFERLLDPDSQEMKVLVQP
ncbi:2,3-butanediol dehydrogenase [Halobacterium sp. KA-4]|uniref:2,3-butanediol dehydrogenase n=1 Tax=Halobacterium sp. KA-4 TaxID=2896367 RepID=UPI001E2DFA1A|nr:2,3-butanediol dehydrogenase [Halobacterium sp. KA-4]MCD2201687.1 2,3-butanediol dehydrogenase [Halobacterium sp. KA-4]